jgi:hypothetical protein
LDAIILVETLQTSRRTSSHNGVWSYQMKKPARKARAGAAKIQQVNKDDQYFVI